MAVVFLVVPITVETLNGTVMLSGFAKSGAERTVAESLAQQELSLELNLAWREVVSAPPTIVIYGAILAAALARVAAPLLSTVYYESLVAAAGSLLGVSHHLAGNQVDAKSLYC